MIIEDQIAVNGSKISGTIIKTNTNGNEFKISELFGMEVRTRKSYDLDTMKLFAEEVNLVIQGMEKKLTAQEYRFSKGDNNGH